VDRTRYRVIKSVVKFKGKILTLIVDQVRLPHGVICEREVVKHKGAVGIVPLNEQNEVILVKQYRHPIGDFLLEIPAGKLSGREDPLQCAIRELGEETGNKCRRMIKLAQFYTTPGYSDEFFHLYLATDLEDGSVQPKGGEELEMKVVKIPLRNAWDIISSGEIRDGKTIIGLSLAQKYLQSMEDRE